MITYQSITTNEIPKLIHFDNIYLQGELIKMDIPKRQLPPPFTIEEIKNALAKNDDLQWIIVDGNLAGYIWFEKREDCIYIAGVAIHPEFQGSGIIQHILNSAEQKAKNLNLPLCKLAAIPLNGRAVNAYLKYGYEITRCIEAFFGPGYPDSFRFIMEKNIVRKATQKFSDECEILCSDYKKLKDATDHSYVGIILKRSEDSKNSGNRIIFVK